MGPGQPNSERLTVSSVEPELTSSGIRVGGFYWGLLFSLPPACRVWDPGVAQIPFLSASLFGRMKQAILGSA